MRDYPSLFRWFPTPPLLIPHFYDVRTFLHDFLRLQLGLPKRVVQLKDWLSVWMLPNII